ncbi:hypothetical protein [Gracilimonas tropica]|uniref:hypothetical protein n=1 Tax=Gracilimonas tropica TaxID=454600 RepID=UPI00036FB8B6|nr:hypothetical protein [Gracilimonas tropica]
MSKQHKENPIPRVKPPTVHVTDEDQSDQPRTALEKVEVPDVEITKPKKKKSMLKKILANKIVRGIGSVLGGVLGAGGSILAGLDPEFALVVGVTAVIAIFGGMKKAAEFKELFDEDLKDNSNRK